jgi:hypothetical protein
MLAADLPVGLSRQGRSPPRGDVAAGFLVSRED